MTNVTRKEKVLSGYYRIKVGEKEYRVYALDLKMISKRKRIKRPPLPSFYKDHQFNFNIDTKIIQLANRCEGVQLEQ
jgi:hypothetical protein